MIKLSSLPEEYDNFYGFTLIELLIVITVMALLFGLGLANYRDFSRRQVVEQVARQLRGDLRFAQTLASSGSKPVGCDTLNGHEFRRTSSTSYVIEANCISGTYEVKSVTIDTPGVSMDPFATIRFEVLGEGTNISGQVDITLKQSGTSNTQTVTVSEGGEII